MAASKTNLLKHRLAPYGVILHVNHDSDGQSCRADPGTKVKLLQSWPPNHDQNLSHEPNFALQFVRISTQAFVSRWASKKSSRLADPTRCGQNKPR